jgi:hypothetical protein
MKIRWQEDEISGVLEKFYRSRLTVVTIVRFIGEKITPPAGCDIGQGAGVKSGA